VSAQVSSPAEAARKSHSIVSAIRTAFTVWYGLLGGIAAWTIHLLFFAAWVRYSCNAGADWALHVVTAVTLAMTAVAIALSVDFARVKGDDPESADSDVGRTRFLGQLGILVGVINFLLISLEELYSIVLHSKGC
jgi:hypothetical protein